MRVDELRNELEARNLDTKGLKNQLLARLKDALEIEKVYVYFISLDALNPIINLSQHQFSKRQTKASTSVEITIH